MKTKKIIGFSVTFVLAMFFAVNLASAADFRIANKDNGNVHVGIEEQIRNLYTAGNMISIEANIEKGLHAAGNVVTINGDIGGTIYSGAGTLLINGNVGGSVHGGGGSIVVNSQITDDLLLGGGNIVISKTASVGGDLFIGGGTIDIQGKILGDTYIGGGIVNINSEINGNVKIVGADKLILGSETKINGNLEYHSKEDIEIKEGAVILGQTTILSGKGLKDGTSKGTLFSLIFVILSISILVKVCGLIIVGLILIYLFKNLTEKVVRESLTNFWKSLGIGFIVLIVVPIAAIILLVTLIGIWLGVIIGLLYILSIFLAGSLAGITFGSWLVKIIKKRKYYSINWKTLVGGIIVLTVVGLIPIIGWITLLVFMLISLGGIYRLSYRMRK